VYEASQGNHQGTQSHSQFGRILGKQQDIHCKPDTGTLVLEAIVSATNFVNLFYYEAIMADPTYEELKAKLAQLEKEVETKKRSGDLIFKVGEKGGISVYGLGRFPVTLYYEQWNRLLGAANDIKAFMEENKSKLKLKDQA
jgi:hypothetical protein